MEVSGHLSFIRSLVKKASHEIMRLHRTGEWSVQRKSDQSPVTQADFASNQILVPGLESLNFGKVISEESDPANQKLDSRYWLVDPLDGTKEFIAGRSEFVISIGLIDSESPVFGLIHAPVTGETWWAEKGNGAYGPEGRIQSRPPNNTLIAAGSRSLKEEDLQRIDSYLNRPIGNLTRLGSALKFCHLADGRIDLYPRFGPTGEWDTAAGQILVEESGGRVLDLSTQKPLRYGKPEFLNTGGFIALRSGL